MLGLGFLIYQGRRSKTSAEIVQDENAVAVQPVPAESGRSETAPLICWERLTVGYFLQGLGEDEFVTSNILQYLPGISHSQRPGLVFSWFCMCAAQFYRSKGFDILDLPLINLQKKITDDGFYDEFLFDYWAVFFVHKTAELNAAASLDIISYFAGREPVTEEFSAAVGAVEEIAGGEDVWEDVLQEEECREEEF